MTDINADLVAALEPFATAAENMNGDEPDGLTILGSPEAMSLTFGDLRRAQAALARAKGERINMEFDDLNPKLQYDEKGDIFFGCLALLLIAVGLIALLMRIF